MALGAAPLLLLLPALAAALGVDPQAAALLHIRSGFTNGEELLDWNQTTAHPCGWVGIGCDSGDVMYLHLNNLGLAGSIVPDGWLGLPRLEFINLAGNKLSGALSPSWALPNRTQHLDLSGNPRIHGEIPTNWELPPALEHLDLSGLSLSGSLPPDWPLPHSLAYLSLAHNHHLHGSIPGAWRSLPYLTHVALHDCRLTGPLPSWPAWPWSTFVVLPQRGAGPCGEVPSSPPYFKRSSSGELHRLDPGELPSCEAGAQLRLDIFIYSHLGVPAAAQQ